MNFEIPLAPVYRDAVGTRMLAAFLAVAVGFFFALRFAFDAAGGRDSPGTRLVFVLALLVAFVVGQRVFVCAPLDDVGLRRFAKWTRRERLYIVQMVPLTA